MLSEWFSEWLQKRAEKRGRKLERREWEAWLDRLKQAQTEGQPFYEPPPSEKQSSPAVNGNNAKPFNPCRLSTHTQLFLGTALPVMLLT